ncbi:MAG TPA: TIR domain-containing protein [Pseudonocardiaceae bacterium]
MDGTLAPAVQVGLQRFAKPWYRARALRVFRDNANLQANAGLWTSIERALSESAWFVLLASPTAAASSWVNREVQWWRDHRDDERILVVLTEGEFTWEGEDAALPPALRGAFREEPRWVDLRWLRNVTQVDQSNPRLRESVADVASAIRQVPKDTLVGEHIRQHRRAMRLARGGVASLVVLLVAALMASFVAFNQRDQAQTAQRQAEAAQARTLAAQRLVVARSLLAQADQLRASDPRSSLQLGIAAARLSPGAVTTAGLTETLANNPFRATLTGHTGIVEAVAYSHDGRLIATGGLDGFVQLWATGQHDGAPQRVGPTLTGQSRIRTVAFSPNGRVLATAGDEGTVQLWNVTDPNRPTRLGQPLRFDLPVHTVAFSPDGHLLAVAGGQYFPDINARRNLLWNVDDPAKPRLVNAFSLAPYGAVDQLAFSGNSRVLATSVNGQCVVWDISDPAHPKRLGSTTVGPEGSTIQMALSPNGHFLVTSDLVGGAARLWDVSDPTRLRAVGHPFGTSDTVGIFAFSPDSRTLATAGGNHSVAVWNVGANGASQRTTMTGHTDIVETLAFSPDGSTLASGSDDATAVLWNVDGEGQPRQTRRIPLPGNDGPSPVEISANGRTLAFGDRSGVDLWDVTDPDRARRLGATPAQPLPVDSLALSPNGSILVTVTNGDQPGAGVNIWDVSHPAHVRRLAGPLRIGDPDDPQIVDDVELSPDGRTLATAADVTTLWSLADPRHPRRLGGTAFGEQSTVFGAAFSPDGRTLATGSYDTTIALWDVSDPLHVRKLAGPFSGDAGPVDSVAFLADGRTLDAASAGYFTLWNVTRGQVPARLGPPITTPDDTPAAAISPDGHIAAVTGIGGTVLLYDLADTSQARLLDHLPASIGEVAHTAFTPDGRTLVTTSLTGVELWDLSPVNQLRAGALGTACTRAGELGPQDWAVDVPGVPFENTCATG